MYYAKVQFYAVGNIHAHSIVVKSTKIRKIANGVGMIGRVIERSVRL